ncbi:MAG: arsenate reductase ArsC [Pseudomonadota bacterium]
MKILFMCVANSARSQLAEGLAKELFKDAEIESAGSKPGTINPLAIGVMKEIQIDISSQFSKSCDDLEPSFLNGLDYIVTLCAEEVCPILVSQAQKLHWPIKDPAGFDSESLEYRMEKFREARDILKDKLVNFSNEVGL